MISIETNRESYFNELAEVVRVFYGMTDVQSAGSPQAQQAEVSARCDVLPEGRAVARVQDTRGSAVGEDAELKNDLATIPPGADARERALLVKKYEKRAMKCALYRAFQARTGAHPPWGALTGIRPTRLARELEGACGLRETHRLFVERFDVLPQKTDLAIGIMRMQKPVVESVGARDFDLYIGIPFCRTRCLYCSFAAYEVQKGCATMTAIERYAETLCQEIKENLSLALAMGYRLRATYIGGGTPTAVSCAQLERIIAAALETAGGAGREFTVEAGRPDTITPEKLAMLQRMGVSRISINPQTMNADTLALIGRSHSPNEVERAFFEAREAGFHNINMDTIAGLPGETPEMVGYTMERIAALSPENLTVHTLAIKRSSRLKEHLGEVELPNAQAVEKMLDVSRKAAIAMGMHPYYMYRQKYMQGNFENVGYTKPGLESIYNIDNMEETASVLALGAGAITKWVYDGGRRIERVADPKDLRTYFEKTGTLLEQRRALLERAAESLPGFAAADACAFKDPAI